MTPAIERWAGCLPSSLAHHGTECCTVARAWFLAMDRTLWKGHGAPAWIRRRWEWGPTRWPLYWCEAVEAKELDCGAQAALTVEAFAARGVLALPAQLVQQYDVHSTPHWHSRWTACGASPTWTQDGLVYHEVCAVVRDGRAEIWNPTVTSWVSPDDLQGYASVAAVRIDRGSSAQSEVTWGSLRIPLDRWVVPGANGNGRHGKCSGDR
ncbi:MAG TPA: hypothetical protein VHG28_02900 [Longimicrobiaceae bacterium]|nr:hypothetical protein [Longimicrobiaceae bacterium]